MTDIPQKSSVLIRDAWNYFTRRYCLNDAQVAQFKAYAALLVRENAQYNLTAITQEDLILEYHFADSLELGTMIDMSTISCICDVGTGAGFPGLALKIKYPHLSVVLIEVVQKKIDFLTMVIAQLGLKDVQIYTQDWRTFIRKTNFPVELFCARASLRPDELIRAFQGGSEYRDAQVVYWASQDWAPDAKEQPFLKQTVSYSLKDRVRQYALFSRV